MIYQDSYFYYLWKPAGRPSTWGKQECFLDKMISGEYETYLQQYHMSQGYDTLMYKHLNEQMIGLRMKQIADVHALMGYLQHTFSSDQEYGLLNRLDTPTAGFLFFAKTPYVYGHYKQRQAQGRLKKQYLALVKGDMTYLFKKNKKYENVEIKKDHINIKIPLMHHAQLDERMVAIVNKKDEKKGRGQRIEKKSRITILDQDKKEHETLVLVEIAQGARHQIRTHLAAMGYPIIGDSLYAKKTFMNTTLPLHLWSIGCKIEADRAVLSNFSRVRDIMNEEIRLPGDHSPSLWRRGP